MLDKDNNATTSVCVGPCATIWPALTATAKPVGATGIDKSKLTVAMQASGQNQVVYAGHLLYFFSGDTVPGDAKGLGIPGWHAVSPEGAPVGGVVGRRRGRAPRFPPNGARSRQPLRAHGPARAGAGIRHGRK